MFESQYIFKDKSKNGSIVNGKIIKNEEVIVAFGDEIILGESVLLPWDQVKKTLNIKDNGKKEYLNIKLLEIILLSFIVIMILVLIVFIKI